MYEQAPNRESKAKWYVSTANGGVYPALRNVPGYEDDNPADWRVATTDEVDAFLSGGKVAPKVDPVPVQLDAQPASIVAVQLADDDEDLPQLPPEALTAPAPAFQSKAKGK